MAGLLGPDTVLTAAVTQDRKAENNSGDTAFYSITDHAKGVKKADMALSPMLNSPTAFNQQSTHLYPPHKTYKVFHQVLQLIYFFQAFSIQIG